MIPKTGRDDEYTDDRESLTDRYRTLHDRVRLLHLSSLSWGAIVRLNVV